MPVLPQPDPRDTLAARKADVERARGSGDARQESLALADYGTALFQGHKYQLGMKAFDKAMAQAASLNDLSLQAHTLARKSLALQDVGRLPEAFETAGEILKLAEAAGDDALKCDALLSQAQILINSGDPVLPTQQLNSAWALARDLHDDRRLMSVYGALGSHQLALADLDRALDYFESAAELAGRIGDREAELGYRLNIATTLVWQKRYEGAARLLDDTLSLARGAGNHQVELGCLRYLVECAGALGDARQLLAHAEPGIVLARALGDAAAVFTFYEALVFACCCLGREADARGALRAAVDYAREVGDVDREIDMGLNLGEACMVGGDFVCALDAYAATLEPIQARERRKDEAYVIGRLGAASAELGRTRAAIAYHRQAADMARERGLGALEGEQLSLLAMALDDVGQTEEALACCDQAIERFASADLPAAADDARRLRDQIAAGAPVAV